MSYFNLEIQKHHTHTQTEIKPENCKLRMILLFVELNALSGVGFWGCHQ